MFDALSFPGTRQDDPALASALLRMPLRVGPLDRSRFLGYGRTHHLNRTIGCGWHLAVHRDAQDRAWTHLYKVVAERGGRVLVLLHRALEGDHGDAPERFSPGALPVGPSGCEAGRNPGKDALP